MPATAESNMSCRRWKQPQQRVALFFLFLEPPPQPTTPASSIPPRRTHFLTHPTPPQFPLVPPRSPPAPPFCSLLLATKRYLVLANMEACSPMHLWVAFSSCRNGPG